jgi:hypothetical protein
MAATPPQPPWWRRYWKGVVGVLAAFGILGAVGSNLVDAIWPDVEERLAGGNPLGITVREDPQGGSDGFNVAARSPAEMETPLRGATDCDSLFRAAKSAGAVDVGRAIYDVLLEGRTHRDVSLVDMRARILKREPVLTGAEIRCASAGAIEAIGVGFNLDEPSPSARSISNLETGELGEPYFARGNIVALKKSEIQPFQIVAFASRDYLEWEIAARVIVDGDEKEITIDNNGQPFRITGAAESPPGYARYYEWVWYEMPPRLYSSDQPRF